MSRPVIIIDDPWDDANRPTQAQIATWFDGVVAAKLAATSQPARENLQEGVADPPASTNRGLNGCGR